MLVNFMSVIKESISVKRLMRWWYMLRSVFKMDMFDIFLGY